VTKTIEVTDKSAEGTGVTLADIEEAIAQLSPEERKGATLSANCYARFTTKPRIRKLVIHITLGLVHG
jgi:hypothetical protein